MSPPSLSSLIDHTLLKPDAQLPQIETLCQEALTHHFFSVCINPYWIPTAKQFLKGSEVKICTVIGFPLGSNLSQTKIQETKHALDAGADEIDMVINIGAALEGHWNFIEHEIHDIVSAAGGKTVKVILETGLLSSEQIQHACQHAEKAGAHFVKTSTGFASKGATPEVIQLMKKSVSEKMGIKASGGIKTFQNTQKMIEAGATRIGTSSGVHIIKESQ